MDIQQQKQDTFKRLDKQTIDTHVSVNIETICLDYDSGLPGDYQHGFKLYYDTEDSRLLYGKYWLQDFVPNSKKKHYLECYLTDGQLRMVVAWKKQV